MGTQEHATDTQNTAKAKFGFFGFEGTGKTTSACLFAIGLHRYIQSEKPILFYDSETGSDHTRHLFNYAGIELIPKKSRSLKVLSDTLKKCKNDSDILIIDSLTHPYKELCKTYAKNKKSGGQYIAFQDWSIIKGIWEEHFAIPYVNFPVHIIWCSRAKNLFEDVIDEFASGRSGKEIYKTKQVGTGIRSETESSYEPSCLVEFQRILDDNDSNARYKRQAIVIKDRSMLLDGETVVFETPKIKKSGTIKIDYKKLIDDNPTFKFFLPHVQTLNLIKEHVGFNESDSTALIEEEEQNSKSKTNMSLRRKIALENIENGLVGCYPSTSGKEKAAKMKILEHLTGTYSWEEIKRLKVENLEFNAEVIKRYKGLQDSEPVFAVEDIETRLNSIIQAIPVPEKNPKLPFE
jgi:hypothetical protein